MRMILSSSPWLFRCKWGGENSGSREGTITMFEISRVALFGKLNPLAYKAIESATVFCKMRGNPYVELAHWVHQILQLEDTDLHHIVRQFNLDPGHVAKDLTTTLD